MATEQDLETFLECHPYLLAPELSDKRPIRQLRQGASRLDLLFKLRTGYCVVELKKTALSISDLRQINRYCRLIEKKGYRLSQHYLVGFRPSDPLKMEHELKRSPYKIRLKYLGEDVPLIVLWDGKHRRYIPYNLDLPDQKEYFQLRL